MIPARLLAVGFSLCALAVLAGAFGAHALADRLDDRARELWETGAVYLMYGGLGSALAGLAAGRGASSLGGWLLAAGALLFAATLLGLALGGPRWLGAITPLGGALMIGGFAALAWAVLRGAAA